MLIAPMLTAYFALITSAFTSATILPGTSEAAFLLFLKHYPDQSLGAWLAAGIANGLGGVVSYWMGRILPDKKMPSEKAKTFLQRWGVWSLLFAWVPLVGDALPIAAGWLRLNWLGCAVILVIGKLLRYAFLLLAFKQWF